MFPIFVKRNAALCRRRHAAQYASTNTAACSAHSTTSSNFNSVSAYQDFGSLKLWTPALQEGGRGEGGQFPN